MRDAPKYISWTWENLKRTVSVILNPESIRDELESW